MDTTCPQCKVELQEVRLLDATHTRMAGEAAVHQELAYAAIGSKHSILSRAIQSEGYVRGFACSQCNRIQLYAVPHEDI